MEKIYDGNGSFKNNVVGFVDGKKIRPREQSSPGSPVVEVKGEKVVEAGCFLRSSAIIAIIHNGRLYKANRNGGRDSELAYIDGTTVKSSTGRLVCRGEIIVAVSDTNKKQKLASAAAYLFDYL